MSFCEEPRDLYLREINFDLSGMLVAQALRYRWNRRMSSSDGFAPGSLIWIPVAGALGKLAVALATRVLMSVMLNVE